MTRSALCLVLAVGLFAGAREATGMPLLNLGNGHYYEAVNGSTDWDAARDDAEASVFVNADGVVYPGHLVTITSAEESEFLTANFAAGIHEGGYWIGGFFDGKSWEWLTGEEFVYQNWAGGEPNNSNGNEDAIHINSKAGEWNDLSSGKRMPGYFVEYEALPAEVDVAPRVLNLKSRGKRVTVYIELAEGYDVHEIDVETVYLAAGDGQVLAELSPTQIGDQDEDGVPDLMVKFDRQAIQDLLAPGEEAVIEVAGVLADGTAFAGYDTLRVVSPGRWPSSSAR